MMHMTFYWSKEVTLLFTSWKTTSWLSYSLTLLACLIAPVLYQLLEHQRTRFKLIATVKSTASINGAERETPLLESKMTAGKLSAVKILGAVLFGVNSGIGYMLMLAVMSFNGGVFIAVVFGLGIGYFLFRSDDQELNVVDNPCACA
ncbi:copper transporter 5 [Euphorbia peplus]|nr:copper transporter 5 [Euphorbia peplus]